jgi:hypothetical protein
LVCIPHLSHFGWGLSLRLGSLQDPAGDNQENAVSDSTLCSNRRRSAAPGRSTCPRLTIWNHGIPWLVAQLGCLIGEQPSGTRHAVIPEYFGKIQLQGWRCKSHKPHDDASCWWLYQSKNCIQHTPLQSYPLVSIRECISWLSSWQHFCEETDPFK